MRPEPNSPIMIIAEAGVNHNGSADMALRLIEAAAAAGADVVKFQTFNADRLASARAGKAAYQQRTTDAAEGQRAMLRALQLDRTTYGRLILRCAELGIEFLSTPFDEDSLDFLVGELGVRRIKLPSGEITNGPFLLKAARIGLPIILSTGMATLGEVEEALGVLAFGYLGGSGRPGRAAFTAALADSAAYAVLTEKVTVLHCTTEYPVPFAEVNLRAMDTLRAAFGTPVGYSDHTPGLAVAIAAAARGACLIEKHFTLDRTLPGPDHRASLEPEELGLMVRSVREVSQALGDGHKVPQPSEAANRPVARKSLVAARPIRSGEVFGPDSLDIKRPGDSRSPMEYWDWLGRVAQRDYGIDDPIG
jgi:N-acetylneuraminate synthase